MFWRDHPTAPNRVCWTPAQTAQPDQANLASLPILYVKPLLFNRMSLIRTHVVQSSMKNHVWEISIGNPCSSRQSLSLEGLSDADCGAALTQMFVCVCVCVCVCLQGRTTGAWVSSFGRGLFSQSWVCAQFRDPSFGFAKSLPSFLCRKNLQHFSLICDFIPACKDNVKILVTYKMTLSKYLMRFWILYKSELIWRILIIRESQPPLENLPIWPSIYPQVSSALQCNKTCANNIIINVVILRGTYNWSENLVSKTHTHPMNSNAAREAIKGGRLIEDEAEDSVLSDGSGTGPTFNCSTSFQFQIKHSLFLCILEITVRLCQRREESYSALMLS